MVCKEVKKGKHMLGQQRKKIKISEEERAVVHKEEGETRELTLLE